MKGCGRLIVWMQYVSEVASCYGGLVARFASQCLLQVAYQVLMNTQQFSHVAEYGRDGLLGQRLVILCLQPHFRHDVLRGDEHSHSVLSALIYSQ